MPEEEFRTDNLNDKNEKSGGESQINDFPKTTKLLDTKLKDKKDKILMVLKDDELKKLFEETLSNPEKRQKIINELLENDNTEGVILANLPEGYVYNISTNKVVKTEIKNDNYVNAITIDKKGEETVQQEEEAVQQEEEAVQQEKEAVQQEKEAVQQEKEAIQQEEEAVQQEEETEVTKNLIEVQQRNIIKALQEREKLLEGHKDIEEKIGEKAKLAKQQLPEETKKQIEERGYNEQFINDYILLRVTLNEVRGNTDFDKNQIAQFESSVNQLSSLDIVLKNIENSCKIPDTSLSSFNKKNISQTRIELFNKDIGNESLIQAKQSNLAFHDYSNIFPQMGDDEILAKYGKFLEGNLKSFWLQYQINPDVRNKINNIQNNPNPTDEDKKLYQNYQVTISEIRKMKEKSEIKTKDLVEELCIISQIKGMYMCMGEGDNFDLNKANEIESKNGILTLRGHIDGVDFAIRQDTNNPEAKLQTSTKLAKEGKSRDNTDKKENFIVGGEDKFVDSNFVLPTQKQIFTTIAEIIKSDSSLVNFDNRDDYLENLQSNVMTNIDNQYDNTKYVHHYMQEQVKGEKIIDKTISFVEKIKGSKPDSIVSNSNTHLYDFFNLVDFNIKHSTSVEKDKLNRVMDKINRIADLAQDNSTDSELENHKDKFAKYITGDTLLQTRKILNGGSIEESTQYAFDLFKNYENQSDGRNNGESHMLNFDQMLIDLDRVELQHKEIAYKEQNGPEETYGALMKAYEDGPGMA